MIREPLGNRSKVDLLLLDFYALLSEWLIGLYPDSRATNAAPISMDRPRLATRLKESYEELRASSKELPEKTVQVVEDDFLRVTNMVADYTKASSRSRLALLRKYQPEREYLTTQTLDYLHKKW